jgi:hypothetical protein
MIASFLLIALLVITSNAECGKTIPMCNNETVGYVSVTHNIFLNTQSALFFNVMLIQNIKILRIYFSNELPFVPSGPNRISQQTVNSDENDIKFSVKLPSHGQTIYLALTASFEQDPELEQIWACESPLIDGWYFTYTF